MRRKEKLLALSTRSVLGIAAVDPVVVGWGLPHSPVSRQIAHEHR